MPEQTGPEPTKVYINDPLIEGVSDPNLICRFWSDRIKKHERPYDFLATFAEGLKIKRRIDRDRWMYNQPELVWHVDVAPIKTYDDFFGSPLTNPVVKL